MDHLRNLYDDEIAYFDQQFGQLVAKLKERGRLEDSLLLLTADHGEQSLEHDQLRHCKDLYDEEIHVPTLIRPPGGTKGRRYESVTSNLDLVPTILDYALEPRALSAIDSLDGQSLRPWIDSRRWLKLLSPTPTRDDASFALWGSSRVLIDGNWKLVHRMGSDSFELYDLAQDPGEATDRAAARPEERDRLRRLLFEWMSEHEGDSGAAESARERLRLSALRSAGAPAIGFAHQRYRFSNRPSPASYIGAQGRGSHRRGALQGPAGAFPLALCCCVATSRRLPATPRSRGPRVPERSASARHRSRAAGSAGPPLLVGEQKDRWQLLRPADLLLIVGQGLERALVVELELDPSDSPKGPAGSDRVTFELDGQPIELPWEDGSWQLEVAPRQLQRGIHRLSCIPAGGGRSPRRSVTEAPPLEGSIAFSAFRYRQHDLGSREIRPADAQRLFLLADLLDSGVTGNDWRGTRWGGLVVEGTRSVRLHLPEAHARFRVDAFNAGPEPVSLALRAGPVENRFLAEPLIGQTAEIEIPSDQRWLTLAVEKPPKHPAADHETESNELDADDDLPTNLVFWAAPYLELLPSSTESPQTARPRTLVLITLDTFRHDLTRLTGQPVGAMPLDPVPMPHLEAFARESTAYPQAYAPSSWTLPSHVYFDVHFRYQPSLYEIPTGLEPAARRLLESDGGALTELLSGQYRPDAAAMAAIRQAYRLEAADLDRYLGDLFDLLKRLGRWEDSLIVVAADHGELLGERGFWSHGHRLDPELVDVPLLIKWPQGWPRATVPESPVSLVDVFPTLLEAAGIPWRGLGLDGISLTEPAELETRGQVRTEEHEALLHPYFDFLRIADHVVGSIDARSRSVRWLGGAACWSPSERRLATARLRRRAPSALGDRGAPRLDRRPERGRGRRPQSPRLPGRLTEPAAIAKWRQRLSSLDSLLKCLHH